MCTTPEFLLLATLNPPALHTVHPDSFVQDLAQLEEDELAELEHAVYVSELPWVVDPESASGPPDALVRGLRGPLMLREP